MIVDETLDGGRVARKKEETRRKIVDTAMALFKQQGVDATTMEQIAAEADIAKGTLYNYFPVKEAILDEFMKRAFREGHAGRMERLRALPDTRARLSQLLRELIGGVQAQPEIFERYFVYRIRNMISLRQDESAESGMGRVEEEVIRMGQEAGELRSDLPLDLLVDLADFAFIETAQMLYASPDGFDAAQAIEGCVDLFLNGAGKRVEG